MRKQLLILGLSVIGILAFFSVQAQPIPGLFQPLSWEQASLLAARENKLVLVEVGQAGGESEKNVQKHRELTNYLLRNVVAIRMDMSTAQGKAFESRLLMYPYPTFAFFMPYGDLLGVVAPEVVRQNPEALREAFQKASGIARIKRSNSRAIGFADLNPDQALAMATKEDKKVFVAIYNPSSQSSLLMDRNVFNLDQVADFYNQHFVSLRLSEVQAADVMKKYEVDKGPAFLFLNVEGKVLYRSEGYSTAEQLIAMGRQALEKARGIPFDTLPDELIFEKAQRAGKLVFTDFYIPGSLHKELVRTVFADPEVTDFFTEHFVNVGREGDETVLVFSDASGKEVHRVLKVKDAGELLNEAKKVVAGKGLEGMKNEYQQGNRKAEFMENYIVMLARAGLSDEASGMTMAYLSPLSPSCLQEPRYWKFFEQYGTNATPEFFEYVLTHRTELFTLYGEETVRKKIAALWIAGAENFVKDGQFDEVGFKAYSKRLKKEKVEGWRIIVRNARMHAAEKVGDWKTFITLAEEKWNEEQISDAELYRWGVKINEQCQDENIRYKTAQWLAGKVLEMEQKERLTGKVKLASYKGFFEKLVDDLLTF